MQSRERKLETLESNQRQTLTVRNPPWIVPKTPTFFLGSDRRCLARHTVVVPALRPPQSSAARDTAAVPAPWPWCCRCVQRPASSATVASSSMTWHPPPPPHLAPQRLAQIWLVSQWMAGKKKYEMWIGNVWNGWKVLVSSQWMARKCMSVCVKVLCESFMWRKMFILARLLLGQCLVDYVFASNYLMCNSLSSGVMKKWHLSSFFYLILFVS